MKERMVQCFSYFIYNWQVKRDFYCKKSLLVREMKYFTPYLSDDTNEDEYTEIDVHCDVQVFEWLMNYITRQQNQLGIIIFSQSFYVVDIKSVAPILVSSHFLQMTNLQDSCLSFMHAHINEILQGNKYERYHFFTVKVPIDLKCIHSDLISRYSCSCITESSD